LNQKLLLVDFENVHQVDLAHLDEQFNVIIFVGLAQKNIPIEMVMAAQQLGSRVEWQRVEGNGSNALDFYIACHLGRVMEKSPSLSCVVLSKDKGFDPLLRYLTQNGLKCRRINSMLELEPQSAAAEEPNYKRILELLRKLNKKTRPRKRETLAQYIAATLKNISPAEVSRIIDILFANKIVSETNNTLSYEF
jgi:hypothetical protein